MHNVSSLVTVCLYVTYIGCFRVLPHKLPHPNICLLVGDAEDDEDNSSIQEHETSLRKHDVTGIKEVGFGDNAVRLGVPHWYVRKTDPPAMANAWCNWVAQTTGT